MPPQGAYERFRDGLVYKPTEDGFDLISPNQMHHFAGKDVYGVLGSFAARGAFGRGFLVGDGVHGVEHSHEQVRDECKSERRVNAIRHGRFMRTVF